MSDVYIIGSYSTAFGRRPQDTTKDLAREAYENVLKDAGFADGDRIESSWFGNCGMWTDQQGSIRGQVCFTPLVREGLFPARVPMTNVEGGCATASLALNGAWKDILSGQSEISIAMGLEKTFYPETPEKTSRIYFGGIDQYDPHEWESYYRAAGEEAGKAFEPGPDRTIFMDTYAMQACHHMKRYGTTQRQIAAGAAKNHNHGSMNPNAQYRFRMTAEEVLADRAVSYPLTRSMCAPVGDGAAAAIVCSERALKTLPAAVQERAVRIAGQGLSGGKYRSLDEDGLSRFAADRAYQMAGIGPAQIDVAEVHDATSFCEIYQVEMMGFCERGAGGAFVESGATTLGGRIPVNTSGGLVSKGHPVGATGLSMTAELVAQLRGESGDRQVEKASWALAENGGGVIGFDEAACSVLILHREN
ncbi:MAG: thiolase family protein [Proteobacteria bacterium]|nr:thiolase family protein [Pseudomonadota bacterium]